MALGGFPSLVRRPASAPSKGDVRFALLDAFDGDAWIASSRMGRARWSAALGPGRRAWARQRRPRAMLWWKGRRTEPCPGAGSRRGGPQAREDLTIRYESSAGATPAA